jgi:hypothetical protein
MISETRSAITISRKAQIAIDALQSADRKHVAQAIELLSHPVADVLSHNQVRKLAGPDKLFVLRATHRLRVVFSISEGQIEVVDIVPVDRLDRIFRSAG